MITSWPLARWTHAIAAARSFPASNESPKLSPPAADHGGDPVDIKVEDTGMPVSERARYRRFPDAGGPFR
jgi:hypothetical protein